MPAVTIEDCEELNGKFRLLGATRLETWFLKIQHNRDSILIIVPDQAIVSICTIGDHVRH